MTDERPLCVSGGRDFDDVEFVATVLNQEYSNRSFRLIVGYNPRDPRFQGLDQLAYEWAKKRDVPVECFPADWDAFGKAAGPIRNSQMIRQWPYRLIAFPRKNGEWGRGTSDCIRKAVRARIPVERAIF